MIDIKVRKLTDLSLLQSACAATMGSNQSNATLRSMYRCEHSPIRTQIFWIELSGIPSFVSVHLVRHKHGVEHFVQSMRDDRGAAHTADRNTPIRHCMLVNAQALINISRKRLCRKSHPQTMEIWEAVVREIEQIDPDLSWYLVPECVYRGGGCYELTQCSAPKWR